MCINWHLKGSYGYYPPPRDDVINKDWAKRQWLTELNGNTEDLRARGYTPGTGTSLTHLRTATASVKWGQYSWKLGGKSIKLI